jgi:bacterioferritin
MDTGTFIERLSEDLATEYQSIVQYIQHIATIRRPA